MTQIEIELISALEALSAQYEQEMTQLAEQSRCAEAKIENLTKLSRLQAKQIAAFQARIESFEESLRVFGQSLSN